MTWLRPCKSVIVNGPVSSVGRRNRRHLVVDETGVIFCLFVYIFVESVLTRMLRCVIHVLGAAL
jgi:hypothetical protein